MPFEEDTPGELTNEDPTGCVKVTTDPSTGRVTDIDVSTSWRDEVGVAGLSGALLHAIGEGRITFLERWSESREQPSSSVPRPRVRPGVFEEFTPEEQLAAWGRIA